MLLFAGFVAFYIAVMAIATWLPVDPLWRETRNNEPQGGDRMKHICPHCGTFDPDRCVWCDDLRRERNDGRAVDRG